MAVMADGSFAALELIAHPPGVWPEPGSRNVALPQIKELIRLPETAVNDIGMFDAADFVRGRDSLEGDLTLLVKSLGWRNVAPSKRQNLDRAYRGHRRSGPGGTCLAI